MDVSSAELPPSRPDLRVMLEIGQTVLLRSELAEVDLVQLERGFVGEHVENCLPLGGHVSACQNLEGRQPAFWLRLRAIARLEGLGKLYIFVPGNRSLDVYEFEPPDRHRRQAATGLTGLERDP